MRMGEWLIYKNKITAVTLEKALLLQSRWHAKLGDVLLAMRAITPLSWRAALDAQAIATVSLSDSPPDNSLLSEADSADYIARRFLPHKRTDTQLIIATSAPTPELLAWCENHYAMPCQFVIISAREHHQFIAEHFSLYHSHQALHSLANANPELSARIAIWRSQKHAISASFLLLLTCAILAPTITWHVTLIITTLFYIATLAFKWLLIAHPTSHDSTAKTILQNALNLEESALPIYTVLVPLYKESPVIIAQLLGAIDSLDYPKTKLDVLLITEEDDIDTYSSLCAAAPADYCRILRVPPSLPRTKPKACNVALAHARGELLTIYDAEDMPDPQQLRLSVAAFAYGGEKLACMQAPLNYYNRSENILTRLFSIEYSALFTLFLPALRALNIPIPLGGTSNHIRTHILREAKGWDPYNVTEDADLGVRLAFMGYHTDILPSITLEESPVSLRAWLKQRSRWIKGYIQTWLVYMRHPLRLYRALGAPAFFGFQLFVGAPALTFLLAPIFWTISLLLLFNLIPTLILPNWLLASCTITLFLGLGIHWHIAGRVVTREKWAGMRGAQLLFPFYWLLHSLACVKALWQLVFRPHFWEKTNHGTSKRFASALDITEIASKSG